MVEMTNYKIFNFLLTFWSLIQQDSYNLENFWNFLLSTIFIALIPHSKHMLIGFTLLYLKMAMMPLVLEIKMADVGKLISLGNLLVRKVTWLVLTATSTTLILSCDFGADCMTRIAYIHSCLSRTHFSISTHRDNTLFYTVIYRDNSLFPFWLTETTLSLSLSLTFDF